MLFTVHATYVLELVPNFTDEKTEVHRSQRQLKTKLVSCRIGIRLMCLPTSPKMLVSQMQYAKLNKDKKGFFMARFLGVSNMLLGALTLQICTASQTYMTRGFPFSELSRRYYVLKNARMLSVQKIYVTCQRRKFNLGSIEPLLQRICGILCILAYYYHLYFFRNRV